MGMYESIELCTKMRSRGNALKDASFCVAKEAASVLSNKSNKIQIIFEDITSFFTFPVCQIQYFGSNDSL